MSNGPFLCYKELLSCSSIETSAFLEYKNHSYLLLCTTSTIAVYSINKNENSSFLCKQYHSNLFGTPKLIQQIIIIIIIIIIQMMKWVS